MTDAIPWPHIQKVLMAFLLALAAWPSKAAVPACPLQVPTGTIKPHIAPPGWETRVMEGARLTTAGVLLGSNNESGYLRPGKTRVRRHGESEHYTETWNFAPLPDLEKWLYCRYGGTVELYKRLPGGVKACTMMSTVYKDRIVKEIKLECDQL